MKLDRFILMDESMDLDENGNYCRYNDAAALIAKLRNALASAVNEIEEEWDRDSDVGLGMAANHALIAEAEGIEPDKGG